MCSQEGVLPLKTPDNDNAMQLHELRETCKQTPDCARSVPSLCVRALPAVPQHSAFLKEGRKIGKVGEVGGGWKWHGSIPLASSQQLSNYELRDTSEYMGYHSCVWQRNLLTYRYTIGIAWNLTLRAAAVNSGPVRRRLSLDGSQARGQQLRTPNLFGAWVQSPWAGLLLC